MNNLPRDTVTTISCLPPELIHKISTYLPITNVYCMKEVCSRFYDILDQFEGENQYRFLAAIRGRMNWLLNVDFNPIRAKEYEKFQRCVEYGGDLNSCWNFFLMMKERLDKGVEYIEKHDL